tara:strand:+ start:952 stop:2211 length:1260 start_codon:yes stop_codon:yes gene_type:complete
MSCAINNKSPYDIGRLTPFVKDLYPYAQKRLGFNKPPVINFDSNPQNAADVLGKTAWYEPSTYTITVMVDNRHPKDILRSIAHELVHHAQNCRGEFNSMSDTGQGYAQNDEHMREMEREAYEQGNMCFRDWEDSRKNTLNETTYYKNGRLIKMSLKEKIAAIIKESLNVASEVELEEAEETELEEAEEANLEEVEVEEAEVAAVDDIAPIEEVVPVEEDGVDSRLTWHDEADRAHVASNVERETQEHWMSPDAKMSYPTSDEWNGWQVGDDLTVVMERVKQAIQKRAAALQESGEEAPLDEIALRDIVREALFGEESTEEAPEDPTIGDVETATGDSGHEFSAESAAAKDVSEYPGEVNFEYPPYKRDLKEEEEDLTETSTMAGAAVEGTPATSEKTEEQLQEWRNRTLFEALKKRWVK